MNIRSELARIIAGKPKQPAEPQTRGTPAGNNQTYSRFGKGTNAERRAKIRKWLEEYKQGGPYADALDAYHLFALGAGYTFQCDEEDESLKDKVIAWCDQEHVDLDAILQQGILSAKLAGDSYQEILPTKDGNEIWGVLTRDPSTFEKVQGKYGTESYKQYVPKPGGIGVDEIPIEKDRIINLVIDQVPGFPYGLSTWERSKDDIDRDCDIVDSIGKAMHRHGTPKVVWQLGSPDNYVNEAAIDDFIKEVEEFDAKTDMVVTHDTNPVTLDTSGLQNVKEVSDLSLSRTSCSMGVPEEMMGMGRGSTEATATVRMQAFMKKVSAIQEIVSRTYSRKLIDRITGKPGAVWIQFNTPPKDLLKLAQAMQALGQVNINDPFAVLDPDEMREELGKEPKDEGEIEDIPEETNPEAAV